MMFVSKSPMCKERLFRSTYPIAPGIRRGVLYQQGEADLIQKKQVKGVNE